MNKTFLIVRREFLTRIRKKSFLFFTLLMPFLFVGIIALPFLLGKLENNEERKVVVVDKTGKYTSLFKKEGNFVFTVDSIMRPAYRTKESDVEAVVQISANLTDHPEALRIYSRKEVQPDLQTLVESKLDEAVRYEKLRRYKIPQLNTIVSDIQHNVTAQTVKWDESGKDQISSSVVAQGVGIVFTTLIYIFVMTYGMMVLQGVLEEKTNRIMEIMVSSVRPFQLMMGKIVGVALVGFTQLLIWGVLVILILALFGGLFLPTNGVEGIASETFISQSGSVQMLQQSAVPENVQMLMTLLNLPLIEMGGMFVLYFVGGYLLYASFFAAVGASVNSQEDSTQFTLPVTLLMVFGMYAAIGSASNTDGPLAFWTSIFPLTAPIVMMVRIPFGVPFWQELLSLALLYGSAFGMIYLSGRIYRVGILMYGKKPSFREIAKWLKFH